jgi:hypothetical protein
MPPSRVALRLPHRALRFQRAGGAETSRHHLSGGAGQDSRTWNAYRNQYWPAQYMIDQQGKIVFQHDGEDRYEEIDRTIARLLNVNS